MPARPRLRRKDGETRPPTVERILAGRALLRGKLQPIEIGVGEDGRIVRLGRSLTGAPRHDVGEGVILPAGTDLHVHFRQPEPGPAAEDWNSGTVRAALGGIGLVGEMPNADLPVNTVDRLLDRQARGRGRLAVDMLLFAAAMDPARISRLAEVCGAFKLYMSPTTGISAEEAARPIAPLLAAVAATGMPLTVHAEDPREFRDSPPARDAVEWNRARPPASEERAVDELLASAPPMRLHVAHVTLPSVVDRLREAGVSFEVTPHHLLLSAKSGEDARFKTNPPLRPDAIRAELWRKYCAGEVPVVASDHAPHHASEKSEPFAKAPSGVPGVETMMPLLLHHVRAGSVSLELLQRTLCDLPARWIGVPAGRIAVGHLARLIVVDFRRDAKISRRPSGHAEGWTPFDGVSAIFPQEHWRGSERIVEGGEYVGRRVGEFVRPEYAPEASSGLRPALADAG
ncbi:MAG: amidohydrolase family protein [Thermoplasmata archaeon]|nr:amidohydrolase family protein [Thermoplasmata archaeon]